MSENKKSNTSKPSYEELRQQVIRAEEHSTRIQTQLDESQRIAHLGSWEWKIENKHLSWSKETYRIFGREPDSDKQDNYVTFTASLHSEDRNMVSKAVRDALEHQTLYSLDYRIIRADNQKERIVHAHAETIRDPISGQPLKMVGTIQDVTAQRQSLQKLELLQNAIDHSSETIVITDHQANIIYTNPAFTTITGYSQKEALGQNPRILQSGQTKPEVFEEMWQTLIAKKNWRGHFLNQRKDGSLYEEEVSISPLLDYNENIAQYVAVKRDITEEASLRRQLQQAQKMEAIGTLAGGIAHDFNNILTILVGNLELAMMFELDENHPAQKGLEKALAAGQRAKELVGQILTFSRRQGDDFQPLKTTSIIKEVIKLITNSLPKNIKLEATIKAENDIIMAAPGPIHQILINLCSNSAYAMRNQGGQLRIEVTNQTLDENTIRRYDNLRVGNYLVIRVCDTGPGIPPTISGKIFDPYFTTKPKGQGSGIGLATIHGIVKKLNGEIAMQSEVGHGCTFTILLPTLDQQKVMTNSLSDFHKLPTGSEQILLVDDEKEIIELNQIALEKLGYRVTSCSNGSAALKLIERNPKRFDLILTDMTMPKMTGTQLAQTALKLNPEMPIIMGTGHSDTINREDALAMGIKEFYNKPLSTDRLIRMIRKVIDENQGKS